MVYDGGVATRPGLDGFLERVVLAKHLEESVLQRPPAVAKLEQRPALFNDQRGDPLAQVAIVLGEDGENRGALAAWSRCWPGSRLPVL